MAEVLRSGFGGAGRGPAARALVVAESAVAGSGRKRHAGASAFVGEGAVGVLLRATPLSETGRVLPETVSGCVDYNGRNHPEEGDGGGSREAHHSPGEKTAAPPESKAPALPEN
ncbi:hypothetical protein KSP39_PZI018794 [Platanthera zijinensis]|uniref:Uncharacterized protein n=1 Tax=Platanthera zijinensis TaxID=2320716 RepID=A0AAP0FYP9_9ASPA